MFRRVTAALLIFSITSAGLPQLSYAGMLGTDAVVTAGDRARVDAFLDRVEVRQQLAAYGVNAAEVKGRVHALTDQEVAGLAQKIDQLPAGGDGIGAIFGAALLIFLVLLLTDILGFTNVFPFVNHPKR